MARLVPKGAGGGGGAFSFTETWEGAVAVTGGIGSADNAGWGSAGTGNNADSTASPLAGAQSLKMSHFDIAYVTNAAAAGKTHLFFKLKFKITDAAGSPYVFVIARADVANEYSVAVQSDTLFLRLKNFGESLDSTDPIVIGTVYWMWGEYQISGGGGTSGISRVFVSTTEDKTTAPAGLTVNITNGTSENAPGIFGFQGNGGHNIDVDSLQVSDTAFPTP